MRLRSLSVSMLITTLMTAELLASAAYCATKPAILQSKQETGAGAKSLSPTAMKLLTKQEWKGNFG